MKPTLILLLTIASLVKSDDSFVKKFAYTQVMSKCVGEGTYFGWLDKILKVKRQCDLEPVKKIHTLSQQPQARSKQEEVIATLARRDAVFDTPRVTYMMNKVISKVSNFTCVLQKLNYVDENLNMKTQVLKNELQNLTTNNALNADLVEGVDHCNNFARCLSDDKSPLPIEVKRLIAFLKCDKKFRMRICMKQHFLRNLDKFDVSGLPFESAGEEEMAEKLLHIFWGSAEEDDLEVY